MQEHVINFAMDMNQDNAKKIVKGIERVLLENGFEVTSKDVDEDWASLSFKSDKSVQNTRNLQNLIFTNAQKQDVRLSGEIKNHTPQILLELKEFNDNVKIFENLNVKKNEKDVEVSFESTKSRNDFLDYLKIQGLTATSYFSEQLLESKNNYNVSRKNSL
jgi:hypothetical protein